jgi:hypothetical protein
VTRARKAKGKAKTLMPIADCFHTIAGAAIGLDFHTYVAITGPNCKRYNGSRGEDGIEANAEIGASLRSS